MVTRILIMAGGTGGHVFPALAVAERLRAEGAEVLWLGTRRGLEAEVVPRAGFPLATVRIGGLRGKGPLGWLLLPARLAIAMAQSLAILLRFRPMAVLGMGGFVTGPGGLITWLLGRPLLVHEQNAVAGLTNRWLARLASRVMIAFPDALPARLRPVLTGNPVRGEIEALPEPRERFAGRAGRLRVLVLGGSQGARGLNQAMPQAIAAQPAGSRPEVWHQAGRGGVGRVEADYAALGIEARVDAFIERMAEAYGWADLVVCRAGALTVAELAAAGVGAVLVPYPHAVDDHQTRNGRYLVEGGAARLVREDDRLAPALADILGELLARGRSGLLDMAQAARRLARPDAARAVARLCLELAHA
jgi:UDP-N-acetylglucosamine--N-acetylmuramyl-(pentapeptide) pyrophosphoryl-undecaprenol N-acetylglucosamine transferase